MGGHDNCSQQVTILAEIHSASQSVHYKFPRALQHLATCRQSPYIHPHARYYHCDVIFIMTSSATELATPSVTDELT